MNNQWSIKTLAAIIIVVIAMSMNVAVAAETAVLKIATLTPDGSAWMKQMRLGASSIEQRTAGRVKFKFYPGGVMGNDDAVLRKIRIGQLSGCALTSGALSEIYPDGQIYSLPLAFKSFDEVDYVRARMDQHLIDGYEKNGFIILGFAEGGLAYPMTKAAAIVKPTDFQNRKTWAPSDDNISAVGFSSINVTPIPLALGDVLAGLQTNMIDTIASPPVSAIVMQWHSQMTSVTDIPISYVSGLMAIDKKIFSRLSTADQVIVREEMKKVFLDVEKQNRLDNIKSFDTLPRQGITVVSPQEVDRQLWYELGEKAQKVLLEKGVVSADIYKKLQGHLHDYRSKNKKSAKK